MRVGEENVYKIWERDGPEQWDAAEDEEYAERASDAERVHEDGEGLEATLERDIERSPSDPAGVSVRNKHSYGTAYLDVCQPAPACRPEVKESRSLGCALVCVSSS